MEETTEIQKSINGYGVVETFSDSDLIKSLGETYVISHMRSEWSNFVYRNYRTNPVLVCKCFNILKVLSKKRSINAAIEEACSANCVVTVGEIGEVVLVVKKFHERGEHFQKRWT
ncbi:hypothetical protein A2645_02055 [Candidatus Nomurabacteria bacterium RIFCSPHIGHO2_01_FULL_39_9]|uniref:Uncharacterized protein n=1 Tax=Candidatus Nomurabacteria bacterium RIFCSPHIGHO2_01_FULL_39_9 TaxID=1801735 RepID=A0A1F6UV79_9BACT|nr:MAG: hypothetical protein A2645_02055 [Candidatus Nomurabacteria bacterium RIFCSPHIGHO2_01_FULL_39_9]